MSIDTANYGFKKDHEDEFYNVNVVNANLDKIDTEMKRIEDTIPTVSPTDSVKWLGVVAGTANALTATHAVITNYSDGLGVSFAANANSSAATTLNINSLSAIPIKNSNGIAVSNLKANGVYTVRYRAGAFILQGEGVDLKEIITFANDAERNSDTIRTNVANAVNTKGVTISPNATWVDIVSKIEQIKTGKQVATGVLSTPTRWNDIKEVRGLKFQPSIILYENWYMSGWACGGFMFRKNTGAWGTLAGGNSFVVLKEVFVDGFNVTFAEVVKDQIAFGGLTNITWIAIE
ncbi:hypothetical protein [Lysinibacillus fusiformis]|uniref:hypothetical protein n=1 Tax=Lysinibacillus fusiformis TaxID=28031 RepID=UPI001FCC8B21|nr:hypothetical protein [Lysinibacillus fusiformis]